MRHLRKSIQILNQSEIPFTAGCVKVEEVNKDLFPLSTKLHCDNHKKTSNQIAPSPSPFTPLTQKPQ